MQFRLTYEGPLRSTGNKSDTLAKSDHKHDLRVKFHPQLKRLWDAVPFLRDRESGSGLTAWGDEGPSLVPEEIAAKHRRGHWGFVPLVRDSLKLACGIDILLLTPSGHNRVMNNQGDIDGRLKTVLDALALPDTNQRYEKRIPAAGQDPMYVLLADDGLINNVSVETDRLLDVQEDMGHDAAKVIIKVALRPYDVHHWNMSFA